LGHPTWVVRFIRRIFPSRFFVAKATRVSFIGRFFDHWLFNGDNLMFLPDDRSVRRVEVNEPIEMPEEVVLPSQVVDHFIEQANYHWVMDFCLCRSATGCEDYPIELGCLFLGQTAMDINPELGHPVTREEALAHVRRCREAGLVHFVGRNKLDTVWLGIGPGRKLMTVCHCCPCCCLWRVLPHVSERIEAKVTRMPGVTVSVTERCVGCGACTEDVCFMEAIRIEDGRAVISDRCRGCGRCVTGCPHQAIDLTIEGSASVGRAIERIERFVDLE